MGDCSKGSCSGCACGGGGGAGLGGDPRLGRDGIWRFYRDESLGASDGTWSVAKKNGLPQALIRCLGCGRLFVLGSKHSIGTWRSEISTGMPKNRVLEVVDPEVKCPSCKWRGRVCLVGWRDVLGVKR